MQLNDRPGQGKHATKQLRMTKPPSALQPCCAKCLTVSAGPCFNKGISHEGLVLAEAFHLGRGVALPGGPAVVG